jgi:hypothetical protein
MSSGRFLSISMHDLHYLLLTPRGFLKDALSMFFSSLLSLFLSLSHSYRLREFIAYIADLLDVVLEVLEPVDRVGQEGEVEELLPTCLLLHLLRAVHYLAS